MNNSLFITSIFAIGLLCGLNLSRFSDLNSYFSITLSENASTNNIENTLITTFDNVRSRISSYPESSLDISSRLSKDDSSYHLENALVMKSDNLRSRKIILFGAHDRYNFGDLLFTKVLLRLLETRAGYDTNDILFGGIISTNMTAYGGEEQILSMKRIQEMSRNDKVKGPYDIVYTGGETTRCQHDLAVNFFDGEKKIQAKKEKIYSCAYMVPKALLVPESQKRNPTNFAVVNSAGGLHPAESCKRAIDTSDYVAYRDHGPLYPDSAVMTKELYGKEINDAAKVVISELFSKDLNGTARKKYIAVQHRAANDFSRSQLAKSLDEVSEQANATIVFFAAGTAPGHDSFRVYEEIASMMKAPSIVYKAENVWKVVGLIAQADSVLSTSLHVRIMAFIFFKPRVTWCKESKHRQFINLWDAEDSPQCVSELSSTWSLLRNYYGPDASITQEKTKVLYGKIVNKYLESFGKWSDMLRNKTRVEDVKPVANSSII